MKKRLFSILTALTLCLTLLPTAALADESITYTDLDSTSFTEWDGMAPTPTGPYKQKNWHEEFDYYLPAGHYKLIENFTGGNCISINISGDVTLDLNEKTLEGPSGAPALLVGFTSDSTDFIGNLTLKGGTVTNNSTETIKASTITVNKDSSLTLESGIVKCTGDKSNYRAISTSKGTTVTLKGGTVTATGSSKAIFMYDSTLNADGGTVSGPVENEYGTITRSAGVNDATNFTGAVTNKGSNVNNNITGIIAWGTFNGTVENGYQDGNALLPGTITGGTFTGTVTNKSTISGGTFENTSTVTNEGTISGGTFTGTVTNLANSTNNKYGTLDNQNKTIINNGKFVFQNGYKVDGTDITADSEDAKAAASTFISGLHLSGTGYVQMGENSEGSSSTATYYSNSGTGINAPATKKVVTFDLDGDTGTIPPQGIYDGGTATRPNPAPTKTGCDFDGWYEKDGEMLKDTAFEFDTAIADNITLYAKWTAKTYTVTYISGANGTGAVTAGSKIHGVGFTLSSETFTRAGYTQTGWATTDGGEKVYDLGGSYTTDADVTLYPVWTQNSSGGGSSRPSYAITAPAADNGTVKVSPRYAQRGDTVTITVTPDAGYTLETLTVLDKNGNEIELTNNGDGTCSFKMPAGKVEIKASFMEDNSMLNFFVDVTADQYYYDAVLWAAKNGITGGVTENQFAPGASCTRSQIVTFLYRWALALGVDVSSGADTNILSYNDAFDIPEYAIPAFQWAVSAGILQGNGGNLLSNQSCTRAQTVAFLYRFAAAVGMDLSVGEDTNILSYNDVFDVPEYAIPAFQWAVGMGILQGNNGNLMSNQTCTRAQIVTMLYRLLGE